MLFYYIRHGDPIYDPDSLTPLGHEQAKAVAKRLCMYGVDQIYSSPSNRARLTAQPTCDYLKKEMKICPWADESLVWSEFAMTSAAGIYTWCFFAPEFLELFSTPEIRNLGERWYEHPDLVKYDFGRGLARVNGAVDEFFLSLGYRHDRENARYEAVAPTNQRVALFAHQGFGMSFLSSMLDIPYPQFSTHFDLSHSSMTVVNFELRGKYVYPQVFQLANDSHLYREGLMTGYQNVHRF